MRRPADLYVMQHIVNMQRTRTNRGERKSVAYANSTGRPRTVTEKQLENQQNQCAQCRVTLNTTPGRHGFERNHRVPLSETPHNRHRAPNWILCKACHASKTAKEQAKRKTRAFPLLEATGWQLSVKKRRALEAQARCEENNKNRTNVNANKNITTKAKKEWTALYGKAGSDTRRKEKARRFHASEPEQARAVEKQLQAMIFRTHGH